MSFQETVKQFLQDSRVKTVGKIGIAIGGIVVAINLYRSYQSRQRRKNYPKDTVILHQPLRGLRAPSPSPFALKLETWLRMAKIPYQNEFGLFDFSSKKQIPYITYNNEDIADSQFSIEFLSQKLKIDLNKNLNSEQKAVARCVLQLLDNSLRWCAVLHRVVYHPDPKECGLPWIALLLLRSRIRKYTYGQGYGRHSSEEVYEIGRNDLKSLNDIIGNNKFLFGNDVCDVDAALFGLLAQIMYHDQGPLNEYLVSSCPNLVRFIQNMKQTYWSDWNFNVIEKLN